MHECVGNVHRAFYLVDDLCYCQCVLSAILFHTGYRYYTFDCDHLNLALLGHFSYPVYIVACDHHACSCKIHRFDDPKKVCHSAKQRYFALYTVT